MRRISDIEKHLIIKAINQSEATKEERNYWIEKVDTLTVIEECDCGDPKCNSVKFEGYERGKNIELCANIDDNSRTVVVKIHKDEDIIVALNVIHD